MKHVEKKDISQALERLVKGTEQVINLQDL